MTVDKQRVKNKQVRRLKRRHRLFAQQDGICHWEKDGTCRYLKATKGKGLPMVLEPIDVISPTGKIRANPRYASFEHIVQKREGGKWSEDNIVLAHAVCNRMREKSFHDSEEFKERQRALNEKLRTNGQSE